MKKFLKRIILYFLFFSMILLLYLQFYKFKIYNMQEEYIKYMNYQNEKNIVLGSSHARYITPFGFFNFASGSQTLDLSYLILNDLLEKTKIDSLILVISPFHFQMTQENNSIYFVLYRYPQYKCTLLERFLFDPEKLGPLINFFPKKRTSSFNKITQKDFLSRKTHIGDGSFVGKDFFDKIVDKSIENDINLTVLIPPYLDEYLEIINTKNYFKSSIDYIKELENNNKLNFIDLRTFFKSKTNSYVFFSDPDHMTKNSGRIVSKHLDSLFKTIDYN